MRYRFIGRSHLSDFNFVSVLNIGTSAQLSTITSNIEDEFSLKEEYPALSVVPYQGEKCVVTAASLNGKLECNFYNRYHWTGDFTNKEL